MKGITFLPVLLLLLAAGSVNAGDAISTSGKINFRGLERIDTDGKTEDPSLTAQVEIEAGESPWRLHSFFEGGWDGTVRDRRNSHTLFKDFSHVYQENSPFVEIKEAYLEREAGSIDCRIGIQRFAWGRLDEYPVNDLLNPWDYNRFIIRPLEERKIGVPSVSMHINKADWAYQLVWIPWFVPYRLPGTDSRWSVIPAGSALKNTPDTEIIVTEPDLPARTISNSSIGFRTQHSDQIDWAVTFFHGYDPRPVFRTTALTITQADETLVVEPGFVPSFHKVTTVGADGATVIGELSLRAEAAFTFGRTYNVRQELWGYPDVIEPGTFALNPVEVERNTLDYGIAADYRLIEDWLLTLQAQQTIIFDRPGSLYNETQETILWANLKVFWLNQKIETSLSIAYNPEHEAGMLRPGITYVLNDTWKINITGLLLDGPPQSVFGRYAANDQIEMSLTAAW